MVSPLTEQRHGSGWTYHAVTHAGHRDNLELFSRHIKVETGTVSSRNVVSVTQCSVVLGTRSELCVVCSVVFTVVSAKVTIQNWIAQAATARAVLRDPIHPCGLSLAKMPSSDT